MKEYGGCEVIYCELCVEYVIRDLNFCCYRVNADIVLCVSVGMGCLWLCLVVVVK
ncbi:hypothetical protein GCM10009039_34910 [Halocalculus aciditolerans]|uniref:Uncharacterized protein n=1 Tax=Halocalculus aciditolerans TaxID=1383812 RepID=A0A830FH17_9EURY|nr:hypothetical protein GCM10009039_34910 [Halocalculus aciditolerans]